MGYPLVVVKANHLIEASYSLSLAEQRLLLLVVAKLDSRAEAEPQNSHTITAADVVETYGLSPDRAYTMLVDAADTLYGRSVVVHEPDPEVAGSIVTRQGLPAEQAMEEACAWIDRGADRRTIQKARARMSDAEISEHYVEAIAAKYKKAKPGV